ncbi:MAG: aryl-sulfate sulfotransferase, partial [Desulfovibrionaceae bacterium]|nr:aryl-sulfate sulfotransferase [Desulfovibrionaceae bacterium]
MKLLKSLALGLGAVLACSGMASAETDVIPVGTIKYNPAKAWNSYVILAGSNTAKLIDRNGNLVKEWNQFGGEGMPNKVYPGGHLLTTLYPSLSSGAQDNNTVALLDFDGNIVRQYNGWLKVDKGERGQPANPDGTYSVSRQHHDFQLEGSPTGYYAPGVKPKLDGKMLVLAHDNVSNPKINSEVLLDDVIYIVDKKGEVIWTWYANEHFDQFGFSGPAKNAIRANTKRGGEHSGVDWLHINCASWLGPNKWYDKGDKRFHPDNII